MAALINMRIFKTILVLIVTLTSFVTAIPTSNLRLEHREADDDSPTQNLDVLEATSMASTTLADVDTYDQRQNGTENYRIHVDGLVVVVAPVEALLLAAGGSQAFGDDIFPGLDEKPAATNPKPDEKPVEKPEKPQKKIAHRSGPQLVNLLNSLLKRNVNLWKDNV